MGYFLQDWRGSKRSLVHSITHVSLFQCFSLLSVLTLNSLVVRIFFTTHLFFYIFHLLECLGSPFLGQYW